MCLKFLWLKIACVCVCVFNGRDLFVDMREKRKRDLKVHCYRSSQSPDRPISSCFHALWVNNNLLEESGVWSQTLPLMTRGKPLKWGVSVWLTLLVAHPSFTVLFVLAGKTHCVQQHAWGRWAHTLWRNHTSGWIRDGHVTQFWPANCKESLWGGAGLLRNIFLSDKQELH